MDGNVPGAVPCLLRATTGAPAVRAAGGAARGWRRNQATGRAAFHISCTSGVAGGRRRTNRESLGRSVVRAAVHRAPAVRPGGATLRRAPRRRPGAGARATGGGALPRRGVG